MPAPSRPVDAAARMLRRRHDVLVPAMHLWRIAGALHAELGGSPASFGHGGDPVWSVALHLRPDLCHPEAAREKQPVAAGARPAGQPISARSASPASRSTCPWRSRRWRRAASPAPTAGPAMPEHGARIAARLVEAGAAMLAQLKAEAA